MNIINQYHALVEEHPDRFCEAMKQKVELDKKLLSHPKIRYEEEYAESILNWLKTQIIVPEGIDAGKPLKLSIHQQYQFACIFGFWIEEKRNIYDDFGKVIGEEDVLNRLTKNVFLLLASGSGKTTGIASLCTLLLSTELIPDPQIFIGSNAYQQSKLCFETTKKMLQSNKILNKPIRYQASLGRLENPKNNGKMVAMSSQGKNFEGIQPAIIILDEIHAFKDSQYAEDLKKSTKRDDQLIFEITTQGTVRNGYLDNRLEFLRKILKGEIIDLTTQIFIYEQDDKNEIEEAYRTRNVEKLFKSNPNMLNTSSEKMILEKVDKAMNDLSARPVVLSKNFNIPQNSTSIFYNENECRTKNFDESLFNSYSCFLGLDMALSRSVDCDLTALTFMIVNPNSGNRYHLDYFFLPEFYKEGDTLKPMIDEKSKLDKIDYRYFAERGELIILKGAYEITEQYIIDFIDKVINERKLHVLKFGLDPNKAINLKAHFQNMTGDIKFVLDFRSEQRKFNTPVILSNQENRNNGKVYSNNKLSEIHFANAVAERDSNDYILLKNEKRQRKDMVIAHLASESAYHVWSVGFDEYNRQKLELLKAGMPKNGTLESD
jgi:phage terminase large subunit-like protein